MSALRTTALSHQQYEFIAEGAPPRSAAKPPAVAPVIATDPVDTLLTIENPAPEIAKNKAARHSRFFPKRRLTSLTPGAKVRIVYRKSDA